MVVIWKSLILIALFYLAILLILLITPPTGFFVFYNTFKGDLSSEKIIVQRSKKVTFKTLFINYDNAYCCYN